MHHSFRAFDTLFDYDAFRAAFWDMLTKNGYRTQADVIESARSLLETDIQKEHFENLINDPAFDIGEIEHVPFWCVDLKKGQTQLELCRAGTVVVLSSNDLELTIELDYEGICLFDENRHMVRCDLVLNHELHEFLRLPWDEIY